MNPIRMRLLFAMTAIAIFGGSSFAFGGHNKSDEAQPKSDPSTKVDDKKARAAIDRGLRFLIEDAVKWRKERQCATCHHGTMTVWALNEAKAQGFSVDGQKVADFTAWTKERLKDIDKPRDTRPGWNMVNSPAVYLAVMAQAVPTQTALSKEELKQIAGHLLRHQEKDGSWAWSLAPAKNRPPPFFESDEVVTMLASMALDPHVLQDIKSKSPERDGRDRAAMWLAKNKPNETTQAMALRLLFKARGGKSVADLKPDIDAFLRLQNKDGGWSQLKDAPSDAFATGQAIYVLGWMGIPAERPEVARGIAFLVANQKDDGSWPMKQRAHPETTPGNNAVPITYLGSAWATLGLMRSAPVKRTQ